MIVCVCHRVNAHAIARAARSGMAFDDLRLELGVATQCGKCETCARSIWSECRPDHPAAHLQMHEVGLQANTAALQTSLVRGIGVSAG